MNQPITIAGNTVEFDEEGNVSRVEANGNVIEPQADGGFLVTQPNGNKIVVASDGSTTVIGKPKSIGVRDLSKLASYVISEKADGMTQHSVKFSNGGFFDVVYTREGDVASCAGHNVVTSINKDAEQLFDQSET